VRLQGKSVIVTGSSRGIGAEIAMLFATEGASVMVNCHQDEEGAKTVVGAIRSSGGKAEVCIADVRDMNSAERLVSEAVKKFGKLDVLVNNAGIVKDALVENMGTEQWKDVLETNLSGVFNCSKAAYPVMRGQGRGKIVNISSVVAESGNIGQANYVSSKAGVIGLTKAMAVEFARYGILVNAISPGFTNTKMVQALPDKVKEKLIAKIPLKRFGEPKEIAFAVLFLASDESNYMTGHVLSVNGGLHL
jgi:3-oxoacyl-[acyl-carrier protein] reductase